MELLIAHWDSALVIIAFIVTVVYMFKRGAVKKVNEILFYLVLEAEDLFGNGTGEIKYAAVVTWVYSKLPTILKILLTEKQLDIMIEDAVVRMKEYLKKLEKEGIAI